MERYHHVPTLTGKATMNNNAYSPRTHMEFSFSTIQDGRAIPKLIAPGPSGFPYSSQFLLAVSSVKAFEKEKLSYSAFIKRKKELNYLMCSRNFHESFLITSWFVRMVNEGKFAICTLNGCLRRAHLHLQDFIRIEIGVLVVILCCFVCHIEK